MRTVRDSQRGHWSVWSRRSCEGVRHVNHDGVNRTLSDEGSGLVGVPVVSQPIHEIPGFVGHCLEVSPHVLI